MFKTTQLFHGYRRQLSQGLGNVSMVDFHGHDLALLRAIVRAHNQELRITRIENPESSTTWLHNEILDNLQVKIDQRFDRFDFIDHLSSFEINFDVNFHGN